MTTPRGTGDAGRETVDALVTAARGGDRRAFDALYRRYRDRIFALALQLTGSASDADDITQDAFVRAFRNIARFQGRSQFFTWLYRIALNRALNAKRDSQRRRGVPLTDDRIRAAAAVDAEGDPRRELELRESYGLLCEALDRLSPTLRATVVLVTLQGMPHRQAAVVLNTTEGTVAWRVHEARKLLRAHIETLTREPTPLPRRRTASLDELLARFAPPPPKPTA